MSLPPLYLIDAYGLIYRSYFAFLTNPLRNSTGKNVSVLFGFSRTVISLLEDGAPLADNEGNLKSKPEKPLRLAAVFDSRTPTFRHQMYPEYKANRQKTPEDLHEQIPLVEEFLSALGIQSIKVDGFEADDVIAALTEICRRENRQCYILSSDKDLLQLVGNGIYELRPSKITRSGGNSAAEPAWKLIGSKEVEAEWGVKPEKVLDLLSLIGDNSDNIPGVRGIGEVTAVKLILRYGSLDRIYENISAIEGAFGRRMAAGKESAYFSQSLIRLRDDVPLPVTSIDELSVENLNRSAGASVLIREGIRRSAKQLYPDIKPVSQGEQYEPMESDAGTQVIEVANFAAATVDQNLHGDGVYKTILDLEELKSILEQAKKQKLLAIDFETDSLDAWNSHPVGISLALKPKEAFYTPLVPHGPPKDEKKSAYIDPEKVRALLIPLFADSEMTIAAHNAKFDYKVSRGWGIKRWQCKIWDTMTAAWLVNPERGTYSLDSLVSYTFDCTPIRYNDIVPKGSTFAEVTLETATRYSGEDADFCIRLKHYLEPLLNKTESIALFENLEMPLLPVLAEMEGEGIKIEPKVLKVYSKELAFDLYEIREKTWNIVGHEFNLSSTLQLQNVLFVERKLKPVKRTKTGFSTNAWAMEELARQDPVPALILRHRTLSKLKSTYVDTLGGMADKEGRVHTNFVQTGTATGRLSSKEPNLQNIPVRAEEGRRIREAFIAKPGHLFISADYSQIELVVLAHLSQDKNLISAFLENKDVHARTAALIFGIDESEINSEQRRMAKVINFGVIYGMSSFRVSKELNINRPEASKFVKAYFNTYSGVRDFIENTIKKTEKCGYVTTISGRRRYIPTINSPNRTEKAAAERIAINTPIQGSAADIVKTAMFSLDKHLTSIKSNARLLVQVHDELILECPEGEADENAIIIKEEMEKAVNLSIPLRVNIETGKNWGVFH